MILPEGIVERLKETLTESGELGWFLSLDGDDELIVLHHTMGRWIRNEYSLWDKEEVKKYSSDDIHTDDLSFMMIKEIQKILKKEQDEV